MQASLQMKININTDEKTTFIINDSLSGTGMRSEWRIHA